MNSANESSKILCEYSFADSITYNELRAITKNAEAEYCKSGDSCDINRLINILLADKRKNVNLLGNRLLSLRNKREKEINRVINMYKFDEDFAKNEILAGVDEVGRGPLAGPIVAAAVILDLKAINNSEIISGINDSKKLTPNQREELSEIIKSKAVSYSIAILENDDIDKKGIAWCNNQVFKIACKNLDVIPQLVLSDGYSIKDFELKNQYVIKGDEKSASIACASIIAKVFRDNLMKEYAKIFPQYGFERNMGYGTKEHIEALEKHGSTSIHRASFITNFL